MSKNKFQRLGDWIFSAPYGGVPWLVWFYAVFCCAFYSSGGVFAGHLSGFDDHVRMTQVLEWINGHGWYDRTIMRANPPEGFTTIWARIVDIPIATVIVIAQIFMNQRAAALVAAIVIPFIELALLFHVARYFVRPLVGKEKSWLIVLFIMFTTVLNFKHFSIGGFQTGEASHHPYYTILNLALFGAAARIALGARGDVAAMTMGGATAFLFIVGIEPIPMVACACGLLAGVAWLDHRARVALQSAKAMLLAAFVTLILVPMHQPPSSMFEISFVEPSVFGPILLTMSAVFLLATYQAIKWAGHQRIKSLMGIAPVGVGLLGAMIYAFPQVLDGALAGLSKAERDMAHAQHYEANSLLHVSASLLDFVGLIMPTLIAVAAGLIAIFTARSRRRRAMSIIYLGFASFSAAMAESYSRYIHHAHTSACAWLLWSWEKLKAKLPKNRNYNLAAMMLFIALGPFWMLLLPALENNVPVLSQVILFPAKIQTLTDPCDLQYVAPYINSHYSSDKTIIVPSWDSSRFLYYTNVKISFVANYPSHDQFIDNDQFFATTNMNEAADIVRRHNIDLVAVCAAGVYDPGATQLDQMPMQELLQLGKVPDWLKAKDINAPTNYKLYTVDKKALRQ